MSRVPCFEVDCVINFWDLVNYLGFSDGGELFAKLFPEEDYDNYQDGNYMMVNVYNRMFNQGDEDSMLFWQEDVVPQVEDTGYTFSDWVVFLF